MNFFCHENPFTKKILSYFMHFIIFWITSTYKLKFQSKMLTTSQIVFSFSSFVLGVIPNQVSTECPTTLTTFFFSYNLFFTLPVSDQKSVCFRQVRLSRHYNLLPHTMFMLHRIKVHSFSKASFRYSPFSFVIVTKRTVQYCDKGIYKYYDDFTFCLS